MRGLVTLVGFFFLFPNLTPASELTAHAGRVISGHRADLGISFSSVEEGPDVVAISLHVGNKTVLARIDHRDQTVRLHAWSDHTGRLVPLTPSDVAAVRALRASLRRDPSPASDALLATLEVLSVHPVNEVVSVETTPRERWTSLCDRIDETISGTFTIGRRGGGPAVVQEAVCGPCGFGGCLGRCGTGCGANPNSAPQRFTQECFNHDLCRQATGDNLGRCRDEFRAAVPGFFFAPDCDCRLILGGTYVDRDFGLIGTSFIVNTVEDDRTADFVTVSGPIGWNSNAPFTCFRYQPPGVAGTRSLCWDVAVPAVTGEYSATSSLGRDAVFSLDSGRELIPPVITNVVVSPNEVTVAWLATPSARSFLIRVNPLPFTGVNGEKVVSGTTRTATLTELALVSGAEYQAVVFAFSHDVMTPDLLANQFNIGAHGVVFIAP